MWTYIINLIISYISVNLIFALWSIMGLDTYCCLIFYGFTLIHLTDPLSKMVQIMCVMCNIYMNLFTHTHTYIYIYIYMCAFGETPHFLLLEALHAHTLTLGLNFWGGKGRTHLSLILVPSRT